MRTSSSLQMGAKSRASLGWVRTVRWKRALLHKSDSTHALNTKACDILWASACCRSRGGRERSIDPSGVPFLLFSSI